MPITIDYHPIFFNMKAFLNNIKLPRAKSEDKPHARSYLRSLSFQSRLKKPIKKGEDPQHKETAHTMQSPSEKDVFRYRYNYGANLGGIFVLERWMFGSMFDATSNAGSELDAVKAYRNHPVLDLAEISNGHSVPLQTEGLGLPERNGRPTGPLPLQMRTYPS